MAEPVAGSTAGPARRRFQPAPEAVAYGVVLALALGTRLWDLGGRALHYDEILHAWYAWRFAEGMGYAHTPITHGPFLFHANALVYQIFGSSDVTARLLPALYGVALVGLPWFLRKELGRVGAFALAMFFLLSPTLLYFARFIRNDIYMAVYVMLAVIIIFRYRERRRTWLLFAWVIVWALAFSTKETAYVIAPLIGLPLFVWSAPAFVQWARGQRALSSLPPAGDLLLVLVTLTLPLWAPVLGLVQGLFDIVLVNPDPNDPRVSAGTLVRAAAETGAPVGGALYIAVVAVVVLGLVAIAVGVTWDRRRWPWLAAVFVGIWLVLFTSLFQNGQGFFTGLWGSLGYWVAQHGVERAGQPEYYYVLGAVTYEFAVLVPGLASGVFLLMWRRTAVHSFLLYWAAATFLAFSLAGERMPWLLVNLVVPLAVVAARGIGLLVEAAPWRRGLAGRGLAFVAVAVVVLGAGFTVVVGQRAVYAYAGFERPRELLVYSQTGQESKYADGCLRRLARDTGLGTEGLRVLSDESDNMAWQWRWYLRDFRNVQYAFLDTQPLTATPQADVVLLSRNAEVRNTEKLGGFVQVGEMHQLWWFPNAVYKDIPLSKVLRKMASAEGWRGTWDYWLRRRMGTDMYRADSAVYVRAELAGLAAGCTAPRATKP